MKNFKKLGAVFLALAMVVTLLVPLGKVSAISEQTYDLVIHKILMDETTFKNFSTEEKDSKIFGKDGETPYTGAKIEQDNFNKYFAGKNDLATGEYVKEIAGVAFDIYQEVDKSKTAGPGETILEHADSILGGLGEKDHKYKFIRTETTQKDGATAKGLVEGTYIIVENRTKSTYKGKEGQLLAKSKAIPVKVKLPQAKVDGSGVFTKGNDALHIYPKNTEDKPKVDKNFRNDVDNKLKQNDATGTNIPGDHLGAQPEKIESERKKKDATVKVGDIVPYEVKTLIAAGTGYENLTWTDTMTNGLTLDGNVDIKATYATDKEINLTEGQDNDYILTKDDRGFTLQLTAKGLKAISDVTKPGASNKNEEAKDVTITLTYNAKVNSNAIKHLENTNDVKLDYGHKPGKRITPTDVTPKDGELKVTKTWANGANNNEAPANASVTYTLRKTGTAESYSVTLRNKDTFTGADNKTETFSLGNGITFVRDSKFGGTFKGIPNGGTWTIEERVAGYEPTITNGTATNAGTVTIENKKNNDNPDPVDPSEPKVYTGGKKFVKTNDKEMKEATRLFGARFYVKDAAGKYLNVKSKAETDADAALYKVLDTLYKAQTDLLVKTSPDNVDYTKMTTDVAVYAHSAEGYLKLKQDRDEAYIRANDAYEWGDKGAASVSLVSDGEGRFEISGLAYGTYTLEEENAPNGYAKRANETFTVAADSYNGANTEMQYNMNDANGGYGTQIKNKKVTIPQTGGIGTLIFAVVGIGLMGLAAYAMRRNSKEEQ